MHFLSFSSFHCPACLLSSGQAKGYLPSLCCSSSPGRSLLCQASIHSLNTSADIMFSYYIISSPFFTVVITCYDQERGGNLGFLVAKVGLTVTGLSQCHRCFPSIFSFVSTMKIIYLFSFLDYTMCPCFQGKTFFL